MKEKVPDVWKGRGKEYLELCRTIEWIEREKLLAGSG